MMCVCVHLYDVCIVPTCHGVQAEVKGQLSEVHLVLEAGSHSFISVPGLSVPGQLACSLLGNSPVSTSRLAVQMLISQLCSTSTIFVFFFNVGSRSNSGHQICRTSTVTYWSQVPNLFLMISEYICWIQPENFDANIWHLLGEVYRISNEFHLLLTRSPCC